MIALKRAYDAPSNKDGYRVLVERLWPRGVRKETLALDEWAKGIAPSTELRQWYAHDPAKWDEFRTRYGGELDSVESRGILDALAARGRKERVTLVFAAHDAEVSNAAVLKQILDARL
jgi:uncharacterized protein YeaO (DUF488 family)